MKENEWSLRYNLSTHWARPAAHCEEERRGLCVKTSQSDDGVTDNFDLSCGE
jgi:hypothetical protein